MNYVVLGCLSWDNIINGDGVKRLRQFGGNAAYGAMGMRLWESGPVGVVSRAGNDLPGSWIPALAALGIRTEGIRPVDKPHGMFAGMIYDKHGDRREVTFDETKSSGEADLIEGFIRMTPEEVAQAHEDFAPKASDIPDSFANADAVMIAARHYDRQMEYLDWFRSRAPEAKIVMDTGLDYMRPDKKHLLPALFSKADVVIPSQDEIRRLFPEGCTPEEAVLRLLELGAPNAAVKLGADGCIVCSRGGTPVRVPAYRLPSVTDPTGAGDSFCGGFAVGLAETGSLTDAALYGTVSSSFIIGSFGVTGTAGVTRRDAEERLNALRKMQEAEK